MQAGLDGKRELLAAPAHPLSVWCGLSQAAPAPALRNRTRNTGTVAAGDACTRSGSGHRRRRSRVIAHPTSAAVARLLAPGARAMSDLLPTRRQPAASTRPLHQRPAAGPAGLLSCSLRWPFRPSLASPRPSFPGNSGAAANGAMAGQGGTVAAAAVAAARAFVRGGR